MFTYRQIPLLLVLTLAACGSPTQAPPAAAPSTPPPPAQAAPAPQAAAKTVRCAVISVASAPVYTAAGQAKLEEPARKGDAFELVATDGAYHRVYGPSGEYRWVATKDTAVKSVPIELPTDENLLRSTFRDIVAAEDRAQELADQRAPTDSVEAIKRNQEIQRVLKDEMVLQAMHKRGLNPILEDAIGVRGVEQGWPMD